MMRRIATGGLKSMSALTVFLLALAFQARPALAAPTVDPELGARLAVAAPTDTFGVLLTFHGEQVADDQVAAVEALGITMGIRFVNFPIMAVNATPAQIQQMSSWASLRSVYLNAPLELSLHQTKPLIGVDRLRGDLELTRRNGGVPVTGGGITVAINDTGVDGTHADLTYNTLTPSSGKTIQNVMVNMSDRDGLIVRTDSLGNVVEGILPPVYVPGIANTDSNGGHGTHVASTAAGTGEASGGLYEGVAPGARIVGLGSGAGLFIVGQIAAFDYIYTNQFLYNIRVVNNSWGNSAVATDADHPINVASKRLHDRRHIVVVFANGNDGPRPNSQNRWASVPWVISVGASTKDGRLAGFSSRGILGDPEIHPTILTPGTGGPASDGYTAAVVAARARTNLSQNGLDDDAQIPPAFLPNYTQISGASMAAPHLTGVVANILSANPSLLPDEVKSIVERTATPMATYDEFEAGAGLANVHAAVDLAFNPEKPYGNFGFEGKGLTLAETAGAEIDGAVASGSASTHTFTVPPDTRFTLVQLDWDGALGEDEVVVDNTNVVLNDLALTVSRNGQTAASSNAINLAALFGAREAVKLEFPAAGAYDARVSAGLLRTVGDQPYRITVTHFTYDPDEISDVAGLDAAARQKAYRLVYDRILAADGGYLRPGDPLTRMELGRALMLGARVPQFLPKLATFTDLAAGSPEALIAESLRREGVMGLDGTSFGPTAPVSRLDQAVALVRALRLDARARALAGTTVTSGGVALTDNSQIPSGLRGYVQIALDKGLMQAFPAEVRQVAPGQFLALPGPRFEPSRVVARVEFLDPMTRLLSLMFGE
jgi:serine protease AprX